jgi:hypothetical protein
MIAAIGSLAEKQQALVVSENNLPAETSAVTLTGVSVTVPKVAETRPSITISAATLVSALSLATCSAYFSIFGLTAIFGGAFWPIIAMGVALETGKLSAVAWLGQRHDGSRTLKVALITLVAVLMALNSIGIYGYLARAHIAHSLEGDLAVAGRAADLEARLAVQAGAVQAGVLADLDRRIAQIDSAVEESTKRGRMVSAMNLADQQRRNRADLVASRIKEAKALAALQVEKAGIDGERKTTEADLGPVRYLAQLINASDEQVMRWFILTVALLLDPAAVALLLAADAAHLSQRLPKEENRG